MKTKPAVKSKINIVALLTLLAGVLQLVSESPVIPPEAIPFVLFAIGAVNLILRTWFTNTQIRGFLKAK